VVGGNFIAVLAGSAALVVAPAASAQNGFPDYRQAAADQYPAQPPPSASGSSGGESQTGGSSGNARPAQVAHGHKTAPSRHTTGKNTNANPGAGSATTTPVAVPTTPAPATNGSLPFTGSDLSGLIVLALILIATGLLLAAASRATRRRRRRVPA
jgi:hypothetical protein